MPLSCLRSCLFEVNEVKPDVPVHYPRAGYFPTGIAVMDSKFDLATTTLVANFMALHNVPRSFTICI